MSAPPRLLDGIHSIVTPEYVEFNFVLAGMYSRFLAWLLDSAIVMFGAAAIITAISVVGSFFPGIVSALSFIIYFLLDWGYAFTLEALWSGQTVGKRALGLRVIQESGVRIGFQAAALRNLARPVDRLPLFYLVGGIAAVLSLRQQRLGDMLAGTVVVRERRLRAPTGLPRDVNDVALMENVAFRQKVKRLSPEEQELIFSAVLRREELQLEARLTLFASIAKRLEEEIDLDKPTHLSDEKLVLIVAAALAAQRAGSKRTSVRKAS